jgi:hypothetical protein
VSDDGEKKDDENVFPDIRECSFEIQIGIKDENGLCDIEYQVRQSLAEVAPDEFAFFEQYAGYHHQKENGNLFDKFRGNVHWFSFSDMYDKDEL